MQPSPGASAADCTGIVATAAGLVLVGLAFKFAFTGKRLAVRLVSGFISAFVLLQWGLIPAIDAGIASNAPHPAIPAPTHSDSAVRATCPFRPRTARA